MKKISIKKQSVQELLTVFLVVYPFFLAAILQLLSLPSFMKYLMDVAWCAMLFFILGKKKIRIKQATVPFLMVILLFFLYTLIVYIFRYQSAVYYLWGFRNNFRYYVAFIAYTMYMDEKRADWILKLLDLLFWINALLSFIQFGMGYRQDYLGGLFGVERGCNGSTTVFFSFVIGKSLLSFMNEEESAVLCFLKSGTALVIAAMAEIKFFFILYIVILIISSLSTKISLNKFGMIFCSVLLLRIGALVLVAVFGSKYRLTFDFIMELINATSYSSGKDLSRSSVFSILSRSILTDLPSQLFGLGMGNCESSSFAMCNTPFFQAHEHLHYSWFSSAFYFLEIGYIGLGIYFLFFVLSFCHSAILAKLKQGNSLYCQISMIMSVVCIILTFYNSSLRLEIGFVAYFSLALPFLSGKKK